MLIASILSFTLQIANAAPHSLNNEVALDILSNRLVSRAAAELDPIVGSWIFDENSLTGIGVAADGTVRQIGDSTCDGGIQATGLVRSGNTWSTSSFNLCNPESRQIIGFTSATYTLSDNGQKLELRTSPNPAVGYLTSDSQSYIRLPPLGVLERCDETYCYGWVKQLGYNGPHEIHLYVDGAFTNAGIVSEAGANGRYEFQIEHKLGDNYFNRPISAYDILKNDDGSSIVGAPPVQLDGSPKTVPKPFNYVHLGDSYAAGPGAGDYGDSGDCYRSKNSWGELYAKTPTPNGRKMNFKNNACSGAVALDVRDNQLGDLNDDTDLITLTVSGNDIGFVGVIIGCRFQDNCKQVTDQASVNVDDLVEPRLQDLLNQLRSKAPDAKVLVTGYPLPYNSGTACNEDLIPGISADDRKLINALVTRLNNALRATVNNFAQAGNTGYTFIDVSPKFQDHRLCDTFESWINLPSNLPELVATRSAGSWHPNLSGHRYGYLEALPPLNTMG